MKTNALAKYLAEHSLTYTAFAVLVGADRQRVWRLAKGDRGPSVDLAIRIERATKGAVPIESWASPPSKRPSRRAA